MAKKLFFGGDGWLKVRIIPTMIAFWKLCIPVWIESAPSRGSIDALTLLQSLGKL
jgi:hypothetical protein